MILKRLKNKLSFKNLVRYFVNLLYPCRCPCCRKIVNNDSFCDKCWKKLIFIEKPTCSICGEPLDIKTNYDLLCANCVNKKHYFNKVMSIFIYNSTVAKSIYRLKFNEKVFLSKFFSNFMIKIIKDFDIDYITAVPMHKSRLKERGYNQSLLLARDISNKISINVLEDLILKIKNTSPQTKLSIKKRRTNLRSVFKINENYKNCIKGKNILIVDDVFTTGTTVDECAKVLKMNGVCRVYVITIARTTLNKKYKIKYEKIY